MFSLLLITHCCFHFRSKKPDWKLLKRNPPAPMMSKHRSGTPLFIPRYPENALERCNRKFIGRFENMERQAADKGKNLSDMNIDEMEEMWQKAKKDHGTEK